jgi:DNA-binding CsgD family transcriptional regulator
MPTPPPKTTFEENWVQLGASIKLVASYEEHWQCLIYLFEQILAQIPVFIMLWNIITNRIIYIVDKKGVIGHPTAKYLADNGIDFFMSNIHPEFIDSVTIMQNETTKFCLTVPNAGQSKTIINLEGLYKKCTGKYFHFLQQTVCLETDSMGHPFLFLSYVHDVSHIKKYGTANLVITTSSGTKWWNFNFDKKYLELIQPLTKQEKKILTCLDEGKHSKEIAKELFISPLTVDTHRKNLLKKTNCIDTTAMITYLRLVGLI